MSETHFSKFMNHFSFSRISISRILEKYILIRREVEGDNSLPFLNCSADTSEIGFSVALQNTRRLPSLQIFRKQLNGFKAK